MTEAPLIVPGTAGPQGQDDLLAGLNPQQLAAVSEGAQHGSLVTSGIGLTPTQATGLQQAFNEAFMKGFQPALVFAGVIVLIACVVANRLIPGRETVAEAQAAAQADESEPVSVRIGNIFCSSSPKTSLLSEP